MNEFQAAACSVYFLPGIKSTPKENLNQAGLEQLADPLGDDPRKHSDLAQFKREVRVGYGQWKEHACVLNSGAAGMIIPALQTH